MYKQSGFEDGKITGMHTATGAVPKVLQQLEETGNMVPLEYFEPKAGSGYVKPKRLAVVKNAA